jgi:hypothetical protein
MAVDLVAITVLDDVGTRGLRLIGRLKASSNGV